MKTYKATGFVYGKTWGGGFAGYPSEPLQAKTRRGLLTQARKDLKSGALDSGMGFEYLKGGLLEIEEIETIKIEGKEYTRSEYNFIGIGDLADSEEEFLLDRILA